MKRLLITGANSYIGTSFEDYMNRNFPEALQIDTLDMLDEDDDVQAVYTNLEE